MFTFRNNTNSEVGRLRKSKEPRGPVSYHVTNLDLTSIRQILGFPLQMVEGEVHSPARHPVHNNVSITQVKKEEGFEQNCQSTRSVEYFCHQTQSLFRNKT